MTYRISAILIASLLAFFSSASTLEAQFPGDIFFEDPSTTVLEGETTELVVSYFSGTSVLGAISFDLLYDPARVRVVLAELPDDSKVDKLSTVEESGRLACAVFNDDSLGEPFGVSGILKVTVEPLVAAGETVSFALSVGSAVGANLGALPNGTAFGAQVSVTSVAPFTTGIVPTIETTQSPMVYHPHDGTAVPLVQLGGQLRYWQLELLGNGGWTGRASQVLTFDPSTVSD